MVVSRELSCKIRRICKSVLSKESIDKYSVTRFFLSSLQSLHSYQDHKNRFIFHIFKRYCSIYPHHILLLENNSRTNKQLKHKITMETKNLHFETLQLHVGQEQADPTTDARAVPIYQTTSYVFHNSAHAAARFGLKDPGNIYGRLTNPTQSVFEQRIAALEGGVAALAVASGAAAITYAFENITRAGDHIVAAKTIYGGSYNLLAHTLPAYGVTTTFVDPHDLSNFENAIQGNTKAVFIETLGNPNSNIIDIEAVAAIAHKHHIPLIIDNTFGTPYLIRPIEHGADIVVHSATKFIGGHGTSLGELS